MTCELCSTSMNFLYNVSERETNFLLWECDDCQHRLLERRPLAAVPALTATAAAKSKH
jgi:hypothetical protein